MKINTVPKAFIVNALVAAVISTVILETRLSQDLTRPHYKSTFALTFGVNMAVFILFTLFLGTSLAQSMYS